MSAQESASCVRTAQNNWLHNIPALKICTSR